MKKLIFVIIFVVFEQAAFARTPGSQIFAFLKIDPSAETAGMGGISAMPGIESIYKNQSIIPWIRTKEINIQHMLYVHDVSYDVFNYVSPLNDNSGLSFTFGTLSVGGIKRTRYDVSSIYGYVQDGSVDFSDKVLNICYGHRFDSDISIGLSLKTAGETIDNESVYGTMASVSGTYYPVNKNYLMNAGIFNIGSGIKGSELPSGLFAGVGVHIMHKSYFLCESTFYSDQTTVVSIGSNIFLNDFVSLRAGYKNQLEYHNLGMPANNGFSCGLGFNFRGLKIDYAWSSLNELGQSNRISLTFKL